MTLWRAAAQLMQTRQPVTAKIMLLLAGVGALTGLIFGYVMMGTIHAVRLNAMQ